MRALLVDDSSVMKKIQKGLLEELNINSSTAENGQEAMDILKEDSNFDIIFLDINMPEKDGLETLKEIRASKDYKSIPVVMCSSVADKLKIAEAVRNGANNYIIKPFDGEFFKAKVEKLLKLNP